MSLALPPDHRRSFVFQLSSLPAPQNGRVSYPQAAGRPQAAILSSPSRFTFSPHKVKHIIDKQVHISVLIMDTANRFNGKRPS